MPRNCQYVACMYINTLAEAILQNCTYAVHLFRVVQTVKIQPVSMSSFVGYTQTKSNILWLLL